MEDFTISIRGYGVVDRDVKEGGHSGRVFVPKSWIGKRVRVILVQEGVK